jgi:hypothetical protein
MPREHEVRINRKETPKPTEKTWVLYAALDGETLEVQVVTRVWATLLQEFSVNPASLVDQVPDAALTRVEAWAQYLVDREGPPEGGVLVIFEAPEL